MRKVGSRWLNTLVTSESSIFLSILLINGTYTILLLILRTIDIFLGITSKNFGFYTIYKDFIAVLDDPLEVIK